MLCLGGARALPGMLPCPMQGQGRAVHAGAKSIHESIDLFTPWCWSNRGNNKQKNIDSADAGGDTTATTYNDDADDPGDDFRLFCFKCNYYFWLEGPKLFAHINHHHHHQQQQQEQP